MLSVSGLNQYYGGSHILRNVGFEARLGEVTVVLGRNGVGKTTLLKSLMGVVPVKTGRVVLDGVDITRTTPYERVERGIGYVPQGREIFGRLTVEENLRMGLATKRGGTAIPAELFELFPVLGQMMQRRGGDLVAFDPRSTHAQCAYDWSTDDRFACLCHEGFFALDGSVVSGPPPRPLDRFSVRQTDGAIELEVPADFSTPRPDA